MVRCAEDEWKRCGSCRQSYSFLTVGILAVLALLIVLSMGYTLFQYSTDNVLGMTGFVQQVVWRGVLTIFAAVIFTACLVKIKKADGRFGPCNMPWKPLPALWRPFPASRFGFGHPLFGRFRDRILE